ncbi:hypothetical protein DRE_04470 [Drechslerella stenobrocha 248]|uniref:Uncharacterized protein n=1 Tax=Drechslerella stenobrocha 248 TaxID=1043628 RepID=W7HSR8_9PEZI|nr:hypothetical protein DRE_04470 [Drechslerella stenobrocha 248]
MSMQGKQRLERAIVEFKDSLQPDDRKVLDNLANPTAEDVVQLVKDVEERLRKKQKRRRALQDSPFSTFIRSIQQFSGIVDACVQANPEIAALVWGGMKFVVLAFSNYLNYLEEIIDMCEGIGRLCPQYDRFSNLFPKHGELQDCICEFYAVVVDFFREALLFLRSSALKQLATATFNPFKDKFSDILKLLDVVSKTIDGEIRLSSEFEEHAERVNSATARAEATNFYALARTTYQDYQEDRIKLSAEAKRSQRERILRNISDYPYYCDFTDNLQKRQEACGRWIFETPEYKSWLGLPESGGLWYHAIPGFGKSVLTAGVVESLLELSRTERVRHNVSYFFCAYTNPSSLTARTIVSSILHQLFYYSNDLPQDLADSLESRFNDKISSSRALIVDFQRFSIQILQNNKARNFIVVDGLDECNDKERGIVLRTLKEILAGMPNNLKILVSSRSAQDIDRALKDFQRLDLGTSNQEDVELFITQTLQDKELEGQLPKLSIDLLDKVKAFLLNNAKGLFLWVDLLIVEICKESRPEDIEAALPGLPKDIDELYDRVLDRIVRLRQPQVAKQIFRWLTRATRPLTLDELKEAVTIGDPSVSSCASLKRQTQMDDLKWLQNCENLVVTNKGSKTIQFAHSTVTLFLETSDLRDTHAIFKTTLADHKLLAEACIRYFQLPEITDPRSGYRHTFFKKDEFTTGGLVAGSVQGASGTWAGWLVQKAHHYTKLTVEGIVTSGSARVTTGDIKLTINRPFGKALQQYTFLEYATGNWMNHYCEYNNYCQLSDEETAMILTLGLTKHVSIRFPWQNFFTPKSSTFEEDFYSILDWALKARMKHVVIMVINKFFQDSKRHGLIADYWFEADRVTEYDSVTRFEILCRSSDLGLDEDLWRQIVYTLPYSSSHRKPRNLVYLFCMNFRAVQEILLCACKNADIVVWEAMMELLSQAESAATDTRRTRLMITSAPSKDRYLPAFCMPADPGFTYLFEVGYPKMVSAALKTNCLPILDSLNEDRRFQYFKSNPPPDACLYYCCAAMDYYRSLCSGGPTVRYSPIAGEDPQQEMRRKIDVVSSLNTVWSTDPEALRRMSILVSPGYRWVRADSVVGDHFLIQIAAKFKLTAVVEVLCVTPFPGTTAGGVCDVDRTTPKAPRTALSYAIEHHDVEMTRILLDRRANAVVGLHKDTVADEHTTGFEQPGFRPPLGQWVISPLGAFLRDPNQEIGDLLFQDRWEGGEILGRLLHYSRQKSRQEGLTVWDILLSTAEKERQKSGPAKTLDDHALRGLLWAMKESRFDEVKELARQLVPDIL